VDGVSVPAEIATEGHKVTVRPQISEQAMAAARAADHERDVGTLSQTFSSGDLTNPSSALADTMTRPLARVTPAEAGVESSIDIGGERGRLTSLLVKGSGAATLDVRLSLEAE
jgi:hypothetical protein